jgi:cyclopropane-fatty-acyl-phospholipid synthase
MTQLTRESAPSYTPPPARPRPGARGAERLLLGLFDRHLEDGGLRLIVRGEGVVVGRGASAERVAIRIHDDRFFGRVLSAGNLGLGESYMDRDWDMEEGDIADLLALFLRNRLDRQVKGDVRTALVVLRVQFANLFRQPHWKHAQFHYDLGTDLFEAFLDPKTMMYSCGYAETPDDTVEQMQFNKLDRICRKVGMKPGDHVLDIGCGFGGLLIHAAAHYGVTGVGITTSHDHRELGSRRIAEAGLADRVRLELRDHRTVEGRFDRVVSTGMFEHLPRTEYGRFFERIAGVLPPHGTGLVHTVGCYAERNGHDPFTQKYMLPGSRQPKLSEIATACERQTLAILDIENIVRHYDRTIQGWLARFRANKHRLDQRKYDARFQRMWEYYLSCAMAGSRASDAAVYQVLFAKDYAAPMPFHRI